MPVLLIRGLPGVTLRNRLVKSFSTKSLRVLSEKNGIPGDDGFAAKVPSDAKVEKLMQKSDADLLVRHYLKLPFT